MLRQLHIDRSEANGMLSRAVRVVLSFHLNKVPVCTASCSPESSPSREQDTLIITIHQVWFFTGWQAFCPAVEPSLMSKQQAHKHTFVKNRLELLQLAP